MRYIRTILAIGLLAGSLFAVGCAGPKFSPVNFEEPGWNVTQTQAVWTPKKDGPEIAGDLIIATNQSRHVFINFSKTLPLITAQSSSEGWRIEAPENRKFSAPGKPPKRILWFQIVDAQQGNLPTKPWSIQKAENRLEISNLATGEKIEIFSN